MRVLVTCKNEVDRKIKELDCSQDFSLYESLGIFQMLKAAYSAVLGPIWPNFELVRDVMDVLSYLQV